jgi:hypothetical protein
MTQSSTERTDDITRRVRWHVQRAADSLDLACLALARVSELDPRWRSEFGADADVLATKLTLLRDLLDADA